MFDMCVYSVFDSKAECFSRPVFYSNDAMASRAFEVAVNSPESEMFMHPQDFTMFKVGSFSVSNGKLSGVDPVSVANGLQLKHEVK